MKGVKKFLFIGWIVVILGLVGCGTQEEFASAVSKPTYVDWEQGFQKGPISEGNQMYSIDYWEMSHNPSEKYISYRVEDIRCSGEEYLDLCRYSSEEESAYYLESVLLAGGETTYCKLNPREWGIESDYIWGFDVLGENCYFGVGIYDSEEEQWSALPKQCYIVTADRQGVCQTQIDITAGLMELEAEGALQALYLDGNGYIYVLTRSRDNRDSLYILDKEGDAITSFVCPVASKDMIFEPVRDDSGRIFFPVKDSTERATRLLWKNVADDFAELTRFDNATIETWYTMRGSELYYVEKGGIVKWDVVTGLRETIYQLKEKGVDDPLATSLFWNKEGNACLRYTSKTEDWVSVLSWKKPELKEPVSISILQNGEGAKFVESSMAIFARKHPGYPITVDVTAGKEESMKDRVLIDVINGSGPDVMYLSYEDLERLQKKEALLQIDDFISETVSNELLPGVKEFGRMEGKLYGMPIGVTIATMFTNREVWNEAGWSMEDVLQLLNERPEITSIFASQYGFCEPQEMLSCLLQYDLEQRQSTFVDWKNGISCFEAKDFMKLLETVRHYDALQYENFDNDVTGRVRNGTALAYYTTWLDGESFFCLRDEMGPDSYAVGIPSENKQGSYMLTDGLLVINRSISEEKQETVKALFTYLYSRDCQKRMHNTISVLKDMVDTRVWYHEDEEKYYWLDGSDVWTLLPKREDGTTYTEEYKEFLNSTVPYKGASPLFDIVWEESIAFFEGERDALTVTRLIDNRVQLYLDENK